jgi:hypothetical protein
MEVLLTPVGNATGPQLGFEVLVPGAGTYTSNAQVTVPTLSGAGVINITSNAATPQVTLTF